MTPRFSSRGSVSIRSMLWSWVVLVEEEFQVSIPDEEVGKQAFASVEALADYVASQASGETAG